MPKSRTLPTSADFVLAVADEAAADRAEEHPELRCGKRQERSALANFQSRRISGRQPERLIVEPVQQDARDILRPRS
jgi:hypothetical protein